MLSQNIDCHKCGFSNKLGTVYCRNCGKKLKFDTRMLDTEKNKHIRKVIKRAFKAIFAIVFLTIVGLAFLPWGFPVVEKITDKEEATAVINTCDEIDEVLAKNTGKADFEFTVPELNLALNYLTTEHEKKVKKRTSTSYGFGTGSQLGGTGKLGGANVSGNVDMSFKDETQKKPVYTDPREEKRRAWMKAKQEARRNAGKIKHKPNPNFDFVVTIKDENTLCLVVQDKWLKIIPARMELYIVPELIINKEEKKQELKFTVKSAYFGHLPLPMYMEEYIMMLFEEMVMQERKWAKQYLRSLKSVEIIKENIKVTFATK